MKNLSAVTRVALLPIAASGALFTPEVASRLKAQGFEAVGGTPAVLEATINEELNRVQRLIRSGALTIVEQAVA